MKKFRARRSPAINEHIVIKETEKQIVYLGEGGREVREAKVAEWHSWHDTKEEAKEYLSNILEEKIKSAHERISEYKKQIEVIKKL